MNKGLVIGGAAAVVLAAVAGGIFFVASNLDGLVKSAIETVGSEVAGTKVSVAAVKIELAEGRATITGLTVGNPKGFTSADAFRLGAVAVALDTGSVTGNPVVIKDISVSQPEVTYELGEGGSNIDALRRNIEARTGGGKGEAKPAAAKGEERKLVIDRLAIKGGAVTLATAIPGVQGTGRLGDIVLTGIGRDSGGADPAQVGAKVLGALTDASLKTVKSMGVGQIGDAVKSVVPGDAGGALKGIFGK